MTVPAPEKGDVKYCVLIGLGRSKKTEERDWSEAASCFLKMIDLKWLCSQKFDVTCPEHQVKPCSPGV